MKTPKHIVKSIRPGSIAEEFELEQGDALLQIINSTSSEFLLI